MPVPVATTHKQGVGNQGITHTPLETAGPFARLKSNTTGAEAKTSIQDGQAALSSEIAEPQPQPVTPPQTEAASLPAVETHALTFTYPGIDGRPLPGAPSVVKDMSVSLQAGSRCLLIGPNGAGKTTLLRVLSGKHKVPESAVSVLGKPPFYATELTTSGAVAYIGGNWERDVAFAGYSVPLQGGFSAGEMIANVQGVDSARRERLLKVLDVDKNWYMNKVSDGQRRRVQICMGLLRPFKVLLLDEVTVDLDVLGRADLLGFLRSECEEVGATIVYATHIFDGLESWPTHLMYIANGKLQEFAPAGEFPELQEGRLMALVERWLRAEKAQRQQRKYAQPGKSAERGINADTWNNGWAPGRLTSTLSHSSNTVIRG